MAFTKIEILEVGKLREGERRSDLESNGRRNYRKREQKKTHPFARHFKNISDSLFSVVAVPLVFLGTFSTLQASCPSQRLVYKSYIPSPFTGWIKNYFKLLVFLVSYALSNTNHRIILYTLRS